MADASWPWDSVPWAEVEWYKLMAAALPSGVIGTPAGSATTGELSFSSSGLSVTLGTGRASVGGAGFARTAPPGATAVTANTHASQSRRDRIVLRRDLGTHTVTPVVIAGTPAASPTAPSITRTDTVYDLKLFSFLVPPASGTSITGVTDERVWIEEDDLAVAGNLTVSGTASGQTPTASGHFATKGYTDGRTKSKAGSSSPTSNGSGFVTITHSLGVVPDFVGVTIKTDGVRAYGAPVVTAKTSSTFTYRVYYDNGVANGNSHDIDWFVAQGN